MKNLLKLVLVFIAGLTMNAQPSVKTPYSDIQTVSYVDWDNEVIYELSQRPLIIGVGKYTPELYKQTGKTFYEYNDNYFQINSWADYYNWYTQKYWFQFRNPTDYQNYYNAKDNYQMAKFVATNYLENVYPTRFQIGLANGSYGIAQNSKIALEDDDYIAQAEKNRRDLEKYRNKYPIRVSNSLSGSSTSIASKETPSGKISVGGSSGGSGSGSGSTSKAAPSGNVSVGSKGY